ncbi:folylpolyglutamate synthase/dihydrofolate synthase family protein [Lactobacillus sp. Sy-1]|uniref:bifunctional folylpolyglutamate synthase/dihydrofolate synthase n=1 Tax=Lactobacillus sp. Sy-1 TaxID=2109645 RepID=UPI001C55A5A4|nr:Mur ligase family protein [Lactobacillus sp. Sy-1]MBW1605728.1 hypothetical protein [Lactobacillus sp. Sy-1]
MASDKHQFQAGLNHINQTMKYDGLGRIQLLNQIVTRLVAGHPRQTVIRVCGTNGKGSTSTMISNVLNAAGRSVGIFTSPYLIDPLEQIQINGDVITEQQFLAAEQAVQATVKALGYGFQTDISEFESWFLIAVQAFLTAQTSVMVLECGMGGQLDATNAIDHSDFSIFTLIGLDHFKFLGDTLAQIATTKGKMIRDHEQVISYFHQRPEVATILKTIAAAHHAPLTVADQVTIQAVRFDAATLQTTFSATTGDATIPLTLHLSGAFQLANVKTVITWWQVYNAQHPAAPIPLTALQAGIAKTQIGGRFSRLANGWIVDGAHNRDAINAFVKTVNQYFGAAPKLIMVGFLADKEVRRCVHELQGIQNATFLTVTPDNHDRRLPADALFQIFESESAVQNGTNRVINAQTFAQAAQLFHQANPNDQLLVVGSFYTVKGIIELLNRKDAEHDN